MRARDVSVVLGSLQETTRMFQSSLWNGFASCAAARCDFFFGPATPA